MTFVNPLNAFSKAHRDADDHPSAAFDPSTTGDPVRSSDWSPAVGFGDTRVDRAGLGDPRRRPIGFAPPEEDDAGPRYRTELSFKRHHDSPRASAIPGGSERPPVTAESAPDAVAVEGAVDPGTGVKATDAPRAEQNLPFYKRELSFRRKRETPGEVEASGDDAVPESAVPSGSSSAESVVNLVASLTEPVAESTPEPLPEHSAPTAFAVSAREPDGDRVAEVAPEAGGENPSSSTTNDEVVEPTSASGRRSRKSDSRGTTKSKRRQAARGDKGMVGLKIGASQLAAAVVAQTDGGHELVTLARRPLGPGIVVDGEVRDSDALTSALKSFFDDEKLPKRNVRIGLASNRIALRTFEMAGIDDDAQFDNAVRFKAHEVLPVAVHESVLDYRVLDDRPNAAGEPSRRVLLVVAPRDQVEPFVAVADRAGLSLAGIDLEALGLLRAFVAPAPFAARTADDTASVVVAIGHESSTLLVAGGGVCEFTRVFDWGGGALQEAISSELDVPMAEASTILRHLSLSGPGRKLDSLDESARNRAVEAVRTRLTPFARELVNSLQFYQTQPDSLGIGGIVITGGTSHLEGLGQALHQLIGVNVAVGDPLGRVLPRGPFDASIEAAMHSLAVPIGLAIDDLAMRSVDLSPRRAAKKRTTRSSLIAVGAPIAAVVPLVALGALYFGAHGTVSNRQADLDAVQAQIAALPKPTGPTIDPALVGADAQRAVGVANVLGSRVDWERMFRDVARVLPDNVWLDAMTATAPAEATPATVAASAAADTSTAPDASPTDVSITGATFTQTDVARLLARLATLPSLSRVTLVSSTTQKAKDQKPTVQFKIVASMSTSGGAS